MSQRHARAHPELSIVFPLKSSRPLTVQPMAVITPSPFASRLKKGRNWLEERPPPAVRCRRPRFPRTRVMGIKIIHRTRRAQRVVNRRITLPALQGRIHGLNLLEDRRIRLAQILEIDDRFTAGKSSKVVVTTRTWRLSHRIRVSRLGFQPQPVLRAARLSSIPTRKADRADFPAVVNEGERYAQTGPSAGGPPPVLRRASEIDPNECAQSAAIAISGAVPMPVPERLMAVAGTASDADAGSALVSRIAPSATASIPTRRKSRRVTECLPIVNRCRL